MRRLLRLTAVRVRRQFLEWSGARWFTVTLVFNQALGPLVGLFVWTTVFPSDAGVLGYYLALMLVQLMTASYENHTFSEALYEGTVSHELLRPQPVVIGPIAENIAIRMWMSLFGLPLVALTGLALGVRYDPARLLLAAPVLVLAAVLRFLWTWVLALAAFWTERVHAIVGFGDILVFLLGGTAAPIALLPGPWRTIAAGLPFYGMLGLPAQVASGTMTDGALAAAVARQLAWVVALTIPAVLVWRAGVRRYTVVGA